MREDLAGLVHTVFRTGFELKGRRIAGESIEIKEAQAALRSLLNDPRLVEAQQEDRGIRYALVCWLDEILIDHSPWGQEYSEHSMERELYKTRERAHLFWDPGATQAEARHGSDTLEVYYLCMLLGFRGDNDSRPEELRAWAERMQPRVVQSYGEEPPQLDKSTPESNVPWLRGREQFQAMLKAWGGVLLVLAFVLGFLLITKIGSGN